MKKAYINPEMVIVKTSSVMLLAGSNETVGIKSGPASEWGGHGDDADWGDEEF